jgi:hypothetical protein
MLWIVKVRAAVYWRKAIRPQAPSSVIPCYSCHAEPITSALQQQAHLHAAPVKFSYNYNITGQSISQVADRGPWQWPQDATDTQVELIPTFVEITITCA